jgi:aminoglycoside 6'-N-acetyltransferase I
MLGNADGGVELRELRSDEYAVWLELRGRLWPHLLRELLAREQQEILADPERNAVLVAAAPGGGLIGFVEVALRDWAAGCSTRPVGYIEGWYVEPAYRRRGIGRRLIEAAEGWALARGCTEMGSDAELDNEVSQRAHRALGYAEVIRLVCFSKKIA